VVYLGHTCNVRVRRISKKPRGTKHLLRGACGAMQNFATRLGHPIMTPVLPFGSRPAEFSDCRALAVGLHTGPGDRVLGIACVRMKQLLSLSGR
jgi:hypothetical protein